MRNIFTLLLLCCATFAAAQDSILARIIFIGDAGEMDKQQKAAIRHAAGNIIPGKTTVMYLGDNIYPRGMGLPESKEAEATQEILRSQYQPMSEKGAPVYFIPGNHDWDRMGPKGLEKIKQSWAFLNQQNDSLFRQIPANGCPDPVAIPVSDSVVIIAMDSEWWLFPFDKSNPEAECNCVSSRDVIASLQELFYENRYKTILLAAHHPFQSYGTHGGYFSWKDHLFPLTTLNPNLYIPLPVIGSIYPFYRKTFTNPEDVRHPLYQEMIKNVDNVFKDFPNLIHVAGHEHGLQLINNPRTGQIQVVSGGGAKQNYTIKGRNSLFGVQQQGYVSVDVLQGNRLHVTFYTYENGAVDAAYEYEWEAKPYKVLEENSYGKVTEDSLTVAAHPQYVHGSKWYMGFMGKNYRKEWATNVKLPVFRASTLKGGLYPEQLGGGFQSTSLRLKDSKGKEYTFRTLEKKPDLVVPLAFQGTFVREVLDDATSAQHPYSALVVPPVAEAVGVPHATPVAGVVVPDKNLTQYQKLLEGKVVLLEEREPLGKSDNFIKALKNLQADNDNIYDAQNFLKARMLDVLFADWDRHGDQWRFHNQNKKGESKNYIAIPRDRDMVFNLTEGVLPTVMKRLIIMPHVVGFNDDVRKGAKYYLYKSSFLNAHPASQFSYEDYMRTAQEVKATLTDSVLEAAVNALPQEIAAIRNDKLLHDLKARRDYLPEAMESYYHFSNRIVDIHTSHKNEYILVQDVPDSNAVNITIQKLSNKGNLKDTLMSKTYPHSITKEIRLYIGKGDDSVVVNNHSAATRFRIIGGKGHKAYNILHSRKNIRLYDREEEHYYGQTEKLKTYLKDDSAHTAFVPVNLYNTYLPLLTAGYNIDDGILFGGGVRYTAQRGFRKTPYASQHQLTALYAFSTGAFNIKYAGEWLKTIGNADFTLNLNIKAPDNTQNFFGMGNETPFHKTGNYKRYYRARFNLINVMPALRWQAPKGTTFTIGPALQYYRFDADDNVGRFIETPFAVGSYDSLTFQQQKIHVGFRSHLTVDRRNNQLLPTLGSYIHVQVAGFAGVNKYSQSFLQVQPEIALYKNLNYNNTVVIADRIGGGVTVGKTAFYQSLFLGGQGNLLGYRQYRFAGMHMLYNNLELRVAFSNFGNYILKGQFGVAAFHDIGRVWQTGEKSAKWHNGIGAGIYFAPAYLAVFRFNMSYSEEGWYPTFTVGLRF